MSMAPPPGTTDAFFTARRTIMIASCKDRSASSMNCSDPPLKTMVAVLALGHPVKRLYRSAPTCHRQACNYYADATMSSLGQEQIQEGDSLLENANTRLCQVPCYTASMRISWMNYPCTWHIIMQKEYAQRLTHPATINRPVCQTVQSP